MFDFDDIKDGEIGKVGFDSGRDLLNRAETGKRLSELVERIEKPMVIALDGASGSGKSHFLRLWCGAHTLENDGTARVIYFDAFKHDYLDDPLVALTSAIIANLEGEKASPSSKKYYQPQKGSNSSCARRDTCSCCGCYSRRH